MPKISGGKRKSLRAVSPTAAMRNFLERLVEAEQRDTDRPDSLSRTPLRSQSAGRRDAISQVAPPTAVNYTFGPGQLGIVLADTQGGTRIAIEDVIEGSRAMELGVPVGGLLVAVNGRSATGLRKVAVGKWIAQAERPLTISVILTTADAAAGHKHADAVSPTPQRAASAPLSKQKPLTPSMTLRAARVAPQDPVTVEIGPGPLGFELQDLAGAVSVVEVVPDSQAAKSGVPIGGVILSINGESVGALGKSAIAKLISKAARPIKFRFLPPAAPTTKRAQPTSKLAAKGSPHVLKVVDCTLSGTGPLGLVLAEEAGCVLAVEVQPGSIAELARVPPGYSILSINSEVAGTTKSAVGRQLSKATRPVALQLAPPPPPKPTAYTFASGPLGLVLGDSALGLVVSEVSEGGAAALQSVPLGGMLVALDDQPVGNLSRMAAGKLIAKAPRPITLRISPPRPPHQPTAGDGKAGRAGGGAPNGHSAPVAAEAPSQAAGASQPGFFGTYTFGLGPMGLALAETAEGVVVVDVAEGSQASAQGVPVGGLIMSVNQERALRDKAGLAKQVGGANRPLTLQVAPPAASGKKGPRQRAGGALGGGAGEHRPAAATSDRLCPVEETSRFRAAAERGRGERAERAMLRAQGFLRSVHPPSKPLTPDAPTGKADDDGAGDGGSPPSAAKRVRKAKPRPVGSSKTSASDHGRELLAHGYEAQGPIAQGAFSTVLRAKAVTKAVSASGDSAIVAVKTFDAAKCARVAHLATARDDELGVLRLLREQTQAHPHIANMLEEVSGPSTTHAVLEYCAGGSLERYINRLGKQRGDVDEHGLMTEAEATPITAQVASALVHLHGLDVMHRDVKPANVLFVDECRTHVKVCDFGFSARCTDGRLRERVGSLQYQAPELISMGSTGGYFGRPVDMWALGAVLYEMLHGKPAFYGTTVLQVEERIRACSHGEVRRALSAECKAALHALLQQRPSKRLTSKGVLEHPWLEPGGWIGQSQWTLPMQDNLTPLRRGELDEIGTPGEERAEAPAADDAAAGGCLGLHASAAAARAVTGGGGGVAMQPVQPTGSGEPILAPVVSTGTPRDAAARQAAAESVTRIDADEGEGADGFSELSSLPSAACNAASHLAGGSPRAPAPGQLLAHTGAAKLSPSAAAHAAAAESEPSDATPSVGYTATPATATSPNSLGGRAGAAPCAADAGPACTATAGGDGGSGAHGSGWVPGMEAGELGGSASTLSLAVASTSDAGASVAPWVNARPPTRTPRAQASGAGTYVIKSTAEAFAIIKES